MDQTTSAAPGHADTGYLGMLIHSAAAGEISPEAFVDRFTEAHEDLERAGRALYASPEQAYLIWDVLWAVAFYSPDPGRETRPDDWHTLDEVMHTVRRVAAKLVLPAV